MKQFYYRTFARICLLPYIGGTIIHIVRLVYDFNIEAMPFEADWVIVVLGAYGGLGLIVFVNKIPFINKWDKIAYLLLNIHLNGSVLIHAYMLLKGNHDFLNIFSYRYSYFAVLYFIAFGLYVRNLNKRLYQQ